MAIAEKADKVEEEIKESIKTRNKDIDNLSVMKNSCIDNIESFADQLQLFIETLKFEALNDVNNREAEQRRDIEHQIASLTTTQQVLAKDKSILKLALESGNKSAMFATDIKISKHLEDYQTLLHDISEETKHPKLEFKKDEQLIAAFQEVVSTLGTANVSAPKKLFPGLAVQSCNEIDIKLPEDDSSPFVTGCVILPDGDILLCDRRNSKITHFSKAFKVKDSLQLQEKPWDAGMIDELTIIVCLPDNKQLRYIEVKPKLKKGRILSLDVECYGIDVVGDEIYITCPHNDGIRVLDVQGKTKRKIQFGSSEVRYGYLKVKPNLNKIYVTDHAKGMLMCLTTDGSVAFEYKETDLEGPRGLCVDDEGNSLVCGFSSDNLHVVNAMGGKVCTLRSAKEGLNRPHVVLFIEGSSTLIVGSSVGNKLLVFKLA